MQIVESSFVSIIGKQKNGIKKEHINIKQIRSGAAVHRQNFNWTENCDRENRNKTKANNDIHYRDT